MNEPYLDLMVEVNWSSGRVVRDYTFLLDPPGAPTDVAQVEPITPMRAPAAPASRAQPRRPPPLAPMPRLPRRAPRGRCVHGQAWRHAVQDRQGVQAGNGDARPDAGRAVQEQPGRVRRRQHEPAALGRDHHDSRTRSTHRRRSPAKPRRSCKVQSADWRAYRDRVAGAAPMADEAGGRVAGGKIGTTVEDKTPAARPGSDQLKVSKDAGVGKGSGAAESAVAQAAALKEAQSRIADLEKTLKDLQRAVELKNQTMAQLQTQSDAAKGKAPAVAPTYTAPSTTPRHDGSGDAKAAPMRRLPRTRRQRRTRRLRQMRRPPPMRRRRRMRRPRRMRRLPQMPRRRRMPRLRQMPRRHQIPRPLRRPWHRLAGSETARDQGCAGKGCG